MLREIPPITEPLGHYWKQPSRDLILVDDSCAVMSEETFNQLHDYSHTIPTGKYPGKMWRAYRADGGRFLRWYDKIEGEYLTIETREVVFL